MAPLVLFLLSLAIAQSVPPITALAIAPEGEHVVSGSQAGLQIRSLADLAVTRSLTTDLAHIHDLAFSPAGDLLAVAGGSPAERGVVELWRWPAGTRLQSIPAGDDLACAVAWNADGSQLAIACADKTVRMQPTEGGPPRVVRPHSASVLAVAWLPEDLVLSAGVDQSIRVLSPASGETLRSLDNHTASVRDLAVRPGDASGPRMVTSAGADRTIRFWQPAIGRLVRFARLPSAPTAICWTPDGSRVLAACEDGWLRTIDPDTVEVTELPLTLDGWAYAVATTADGRFALVAGEGGRIERLSLDGASGK